MSRYSHTSYWDEMENGKLISRNELYVPAFTEAADASRLVCVVVGSYVRTHSLPHTNKGGLLSYLTLQMHLGTTSFFFFGIYPSFPDHSSHRRVSPVRESAPPRVNIYDGGLGPAL